MEGADNQNWNISYLKDSIDKALNMKISKPLIEMKQEVDSRLALQENVNMIRHLYIIIDSSFFMKSNDFKPSRLVLTLSTLKNFIPNFFDKNPLSALGFASMEEGICSPISDLASHSSDHIKALDSVKQNMDKEISFQNALEQGIKVFSDAPLYSHKEILLIVSSTSTCDPGDINLTIKCLKNMLISCSVISFSGATHILKVIAQQTDGKFHVPMDEEQFRNLMNNYTNPSVMQLEKVSIELIKIGFPTRYYDEIKGEGTLCVCHNEKSFTYYECPLCKARVCEIPTICPICKISLVSSPHLARTYRHALKISPYELRKIEIINDKMIDDFKCFGCESNLNSDAYKNKEGFFCECPSCHQYFCLECDIFVHDSIYNCPGCL